MSLNRYLHDLCSHAYDGQQIGDALYFGVVAIFEAALFLLCTPRIFD